MTPKHDKDYGCLMEALVKLLAFKNLVKPLSINWLMIGCDCNS